MMASEKYDQSISIRTCQRLFFYSSLKHFPRPWLDELVTQIGAWLQGMDVPSRVGLFWASDLDSLAADRAFERSRQQAGGRFISPGAFRHTLANMDAAGLALALQITGPVLTFSIGGQMDVAERSAWRWLTMGRIAAAITVTECCLPSAAGKTEDKALAPMDRKAATDVNHGITRQIQARYMTLAGQ